MKPTQVSELTPAQADKLMRKIYQENLKAILRQADQIKRDVRKRLARNKYITVHDLQASAAIAKNACTLHLQTLDYWTMIILRAQMANEIAKTAQPELEE